VLRENWQTGFREPAACASIVKSGKTEIGLPAATNGRHPSNGKSLWYAAYCVAGSQKTGIFLRSDLVPVAGQRSCCQCPIVSGVWIYPSDVSPSAESGSASIGQRNFRSSPTGTISQVYWTTRLTLSGRNVLSTSINANWTLTFTTLFASCGQVRLVLSTTVNRGYARRLAERSFGRVRRSKSCR